MNKNILIPIGFILLAIGNFSCTKTFLDTAPYTSLEANAALKTETDMAVALRGMYSSLRTTNTFGRTIPLLGDLWADVTYISVSNSNRYIDEQRYTITVSNGNASSLWASLYTSILRANNVINSTLPSSVNVNQYKGEAYAVRALCYFELLKFFAKPYTDDPSALGVPLVLTYSPSALPTRNKISEVYTQILADLTQATTLMTVFTNSSQFSKYAARGLQAKVYLTMGDYTNAKTAAVDVITNSGFTVVPATTYAAYWANAAYRSDKVETMFEITNDATNNGGTDALANIYSQSGYGDMLCSDAQYALYTPTDVRRSYLVSGLRGGTSAIIVNKYSNVTNASDKDDIKVLRLSDVYLIAAEASVRSSTPNETDGKTYVNYIATRRDASFLGYTSTGTTLVNDIMTERRKELAFEGDRFHTLNRLKLPINRNSNYPSSALTIPYPFNFRLFPIPQDEIQANPNLANQQNPGYF